jgi:thymidylate synthase
MYIFGMSYQETQYIDLVQRILEKGSVETGRNGNVRSVFGNMMRFSLNGGIWTTKKVAWKTCFQELMWFLSGNTNNDELKRRGVHIWDANASREFLDSRGLTSYREGDLGPIYGMQWRHWNATYTSCDADYTNQGIDQIQYVIDILKDPLQRTQNRRLVVSAWNPEQLDKMALPPCHVLMQFHVREGRYLSCALYQRSGDVGLGVPFNIASYAMLTHLLAHHCDLIADEFVYFLGNAHIYEGHVEPLREQTSRPIQYDFPKIRIGSKRDRLEDYTLDDVIWDTPYMSDSTIKMNMVA